MSNTITVGEGPWDVVLIGDEWCIKHRDPKMGRKGLRTIGKARSGITNHFDRAMTEAERRNAEHKRRSERFALDDSAPQHELDAMVRSESGNQ